MTVEPVFLELDSYISDDEVARVFNGLKCGKATGRDYLLNKYVVKFKDTYIHTMLLLHCACVVISYNG